MPNAGNPQKVQRFASDWAVALRQMAGCGAEMMLCGHGVPIFGADRVRQALTDTAELLDSIETQTLALMNRGVPLDRVLHEVEVPDHLRELPYLQPVYDHPQFLVRNVWRRYGGWYDGEPDNLLPAPRAAQAREWVTLAGGLEAVLARARELAASGDHRLACHLVEFAVLYEPALGRGPRGAGRGVRRPQRRAGVVDGPQHPRPRRPRQPRGKARPRRRLRLAGEDGSLSVRGRRARRSSAWWRRRGSSPRSSPAAGRSVPPAARPGTTTQPWRPRP